ncbi:MAG: energy-coupling factor transporter ATPase [Clostridia bacterium]|nr:energy-coupling factor transporter ATPase [Clostridia bacterium]
MAAVIEAEGLRHAYPDGRGGAVRALDGVSLSLAAGEWLAVAGANGSGKSTLAKALNGLLVPDEGEVRVLGRSTRDPDGQRAARRHVGIVFQNPDNQIVAPVVADDVAFGPENLGVPGPEIGRRVEDALSAVGLWELRDEPSAGLSGGQKQRLAIAGALAMLPQAIVFDEATSMLDPVGRQSVVATVKELRRTRGLAVVWITHHLEEAALADRVLVLAAGRVALEGAPGEVLPRAAELAALGLAPPPAVAVAEGLREAGLAVPQGVVTLEGLVDALCPFPSST